MGDEHARPAASPRSPDPPEGLFHTLDSHALSAFIAMGIGAASIASGASAGPAAAAILKLFQSSAGSKALPHWVVIRVTPDAVQFLASNRHGECGDQPVAELEHGSFRATVARNVGEVDLSLFP